MLSVITNPKRIDTKWHTRRQPARTFSTGTHRWGKMVALCMVLSATTMYGQVGTARSSFTAPASAARPAMIHGTVTDANNQKLPDVTVRLRNLQTKIVEQTSVSDQKGEFTFVVKPDVPYAVEVANRRGAVVAVSNVVVARTGDVATAAVMIPGVTTTASGGFSSATGAVILAAMSTGLTALEATAAPPVSPEK